MATPKAIAALERVEKAVEEFRKRYGTKVAMVVVVDLSASGQNHGKPILEVTSADLALVCKMARSCGVPRT